MTGPTLDGDSNAIHFDGRLARMRNKPKAPPHTKNTYEYDLWCEGWQSADNERQRVARAHHAKQVED